MNAEAFARLVLPAGDIGVSAVPKAALDLVRPQGMA